MFAYVIFNAIYFDKTELIELLSQYQRKFAKEINLELLKNKSPNEYNDFQEVKKEIFNLIEKADVLAEKLRKNILD